jgi:hypothetical protein
VTRGKIIAGPQGVKSAIGSLAILRQFFKRLDLGLCWSVMNTCTSDLSLRLEVSAVELAGVCA